MISIIIVAVFSLYCYDLYLKMLDSYPNKRLSFTEFIDASTKGFLNITMKCCLVFAIWGIVIPHLLFLKELINAFSC